MSEKMSQGHGVISLLLLLILASNVWIGATVQQGLSGGMKAPSAAVPAGTVPTAAPAAAAPDDSAALAKNVKKPSKDDYVKGPKDAEISLIQYSDFQCPFCIRVKPTVDQVLAAYPDKVNLIHREFPLSFHEMARPAAIAALCVGKIGGSEAFWKFADAAYDKGNTDPNVIAAANLPELAKSAGVDISKFKACFDAKETNARVDQDIKEGGEAGVSGTPGFIIINNKTGDVKSVSGAQPLANFKTAIDALLK